MISDQDPVNLANVGLILLISFCIAIILAGIFVSKSRFWRSKSGANRYIGRMMIISGSIVLVVALMFFIINIIKL